MTENEKEELFDYALKVINRQQPGGFMVEKFKSGIFETTTDMEHTIKHTLKARHYIGDSGWVHDTRTWLQRKAAYSGRGL